MSARRAPTSAPAVRYDPRLVEKALLAEIQQSGRRGDGRLRDRYHELTEPLYALTPEARNEEFDTVNLRLFRECGLHRALEEALHGSPLPEKIDEAVVVDTEREESADLFQAGDRLRIMIKLRAQNLVDAPYLHGLLNHEMQHIADMLDAEFRYDRNPLASSLDEPILRERYRMLWDIYIDSRLVRGRRPTIGTKALRKKEFLALYRKFGQEKCEAVFEHLWARDRMTHPQLREYARDPRALLRAAGVEAAENTVLPGSLCPICGFPTYHWVTDPGQIEAAVMDQIRQEAPDWKPEQGICERCLELWALRAQ